ncbi:MAG: GGDEF domain-containing protein [Gammaproteobacteria bacterium]|nr:GGDEF domain-containing protein [Gammaproteobacteria bacterium]
MAPVVRARGRARVPAFPRAGHPTPAIDAWLLKPPPEFTRVSHVLQLAVELPAMLLALLFTAAPPLRRHGDAVALLAALALAAGTLIQYRLGAQIGFYFPIGIPAAVVTAGFLVVGFRFWQFAPAALLLFVALAASVLALPLPPVTQAHELQFLAAGLILAGGGGYLHELHIRRGWLRERLLEELSSKDALTGLANRRVFDRACARLLDLAKREGRPLTLAVLDVDHFKQLNDLHGHAAGDRYLQRLGRALHGHAQRHDALCGRYGGEEFVLAYYGLAADQAAAVLESLCGVVRACTGPAAELRLSASVGAVTGVPAWSDDSARLLMAADEMLYRAKAQGRDRAVLVELADPAALEPAVSAHAGWRQRPPPEGGAAPIERRHRRELRLLRFAPALEAEFQEGNFADNRTKRGALLLWAMLLVAGLPVLDGFLLERPAGFVRVEHLVQYALVLPLILLAWFFTVPRPSAWASGRLLTLASLALGGGFIYQRQVGGELGVEVPLGFVPIVFIAALLICRLRFRRFLPYALLLWGLAVAAELRSGRASAVIHHELFALNMLTALALVGGYMLERDARRSWLRKRLLRHWSRHDELTGLFNRRTFDEELLRLVDLARREARPLAVAILDLDQFKAYNDRYGHAAGDECLRRIGAHLAQALRRGGDLCARWGGEEFAIALYGMDGVAAGALLERLRADVARLEMPGAAVTASIGASWTVPGPGGTPAELLAAADRALYRAKGLGRDRLVVAEGAAAEPPPGVAGLPADEPA